MNSVCPKINLIVMFLSKYFLLDEPDAPEKPVVTDWDENFVELQWEQPKTDGGSPVTEFTIQKKEKGSPYWVNAVTVPGRETKVKYSENFKLERSVLNTFI